LSGDWFGVVATRWSHQKS